ncbi:hypothetical protein DER45DRAFT_620035 [Fusarium avenaceum]|nr:hypothetical protein DER45DRAFT_620035 [Fusarium avenaceum]
MLNNVCRLLTLIDQKLLHTVQSRMMETQEKAQRITYREIREVLTNGKARGVTEDQLALWKDAQCEPFMPRREIRSFVTKQRVKATLLNLLGKEDDELADFIVKKAPIGFLTMVFAGAMRDENGVPCVQLLQQHRFSDESFPVRVVDDEVYSTDSEAIMSCFSELDPRIMEDYAERQWAFLAPTFLESDFEYEFHKNCRMPFVYIPNARVFQGAFGTVHKLGLHIDHQELTTFDLKLTSDKRSFEVAIKIMNTKDTGSASDVEKFYTKEGTTLRQMRDMNDTHLIRAIAAYKKDSLRCFVFPWAEGGNLDSFWKTDQSKLDQSLVIWAINQMAGISGGIWKLHEKNTRHGDIKPANILYFMDCLDKSSRGNLKIADVGLAKVHKEYTKYRKAATTNRHSSERYEPPEMPGYLRGVAVPRVYDIWSLGCVFLEFTIWLIFGWDRLLDFRQDLDASNTDKFWETVGKSSPRHHKVNEIIAELYGNVPGPSALIDLIKLIDSRLLVPEKARTDAKTLCKEFRYIQEKCAKDQPYCFGRALVAVAKRRPCSAGGDRASLPDNYVTNWWSSVNLLQSRTSKLDYQWRNIPDNGWARILISHLDWHSIRPAIQDSQLCHSCSSIDFLSVDLDLTRSLEDLRRGSDDCLMCRFLLHIFSKSSVNPSEQLNLTADSGSYSFSLFSGDAPLISLYLDPDFAGQAPYQAQLGLPILPEAGSPQQFSLLNRWISLCDTTHECISNQPNRKKVSKMPTRVINVGSAQNPALRLIETKDENATGPYIALSHCWGKLSREERFCTYSENIENLKQSISFDKLPPTFRDAVTVTRRLDIHYLWIDSLCIIQEDPEDWKAESGKMEDVFNSAYCTIAASSSKSSMDGFLGPREERAVIGIQTPKGPLYLAEAIDDFQKHVEQGVLNTRGWVFQERALSRRTIHFTSTQVYWECGQGIHCETLAQLRNRESALLGDSNFPNYGLQKYKDDSIRLVQYLYRTYSGLALTNSTDRSRAIMGLQKRLGRTFKSTAEYGVLSAYFERLLLWQIEIPQERITYPETESVPSWSWMAFMGRIRFLDIPFGQVTWTGNLKPFRSQLNAPWDGRLQVGTNELLIDKDELDKRVEADMSGSQLDPVGLRSVVVGKSKVANQDGTFDQYVLLIRQIPSDAMSVAFERIGAGKLLDVHIGRDCAMVDLV